MLSPRIHLLDRRASVASIVLLALLLRALIPVGFMPSGTGPFRLHICPDGFPSALLAQMSGAGAHTGHDHSHGSHDHHSWGSSGCAFAAAASAPPLSHYGVVAVSLAAILLSRTAVASQVPQDHRNLIAQPRAPPALV